MTVMGASIKPHAPPDKTWYRRSLSSPLFFVADLTLPFPYAIRMVALFPRCLFACWASCTTKEHPTLPNAALSMMSTCVQRCHFWMPFPSRGDFFSGTFLRCLPPHGVFFLSFFSLSLNRSLDFDLTTEINENQSPVGPLKNLIQSVLICHLLLFP